MMIYRKAKIRTITMPTPHQTMDQLNVNGMSTSYSFLTVKVTPSIETTTTLSPMAATAVSSLRMALHVVPLSATRPAPPAEIAMTVLAVLPIISSVYTEEMIGKTAS